MMDEVTTRMQPHAQQHQQRAPMQQPSGPLAAPSHQRYLEEGTGGGQVTHEAATSTAGLVPPSVLPLQAQAHAQSAQLEPCPPGRATLAGPEVPAKKKRGPKAGRKAALAAAAAAAAAASSTSASAASSVPSVWSDAHLEAQQQQQLVTCNDPYAFHCNDSPWITSATYGQPSSAASEPGAASDQQSTLTRHGNQSVGQRQHHLSFQQHRQQESFCTSTTQNGAQYHTSTTTTTTTSTTTTTTHRQQATKQATLVQRNEPTIANEPHKQQQQEQINNNNNNNNNRFQLSQARASSENYFSPNTVAYGREEEANSSGRRKPEAHMIAHKQQAQVLVAPPGQQQLLGRGQHHTHHHNHNHNHHHHQHQQQSMQGQGNAMHQAPHLLSVGQQQMHEPQAQYYGDQQQAQQQQYPSSNSSADHLNTYHMQPQQHYGQQPPPPQQQQHTSGAMAVGVTVSGPPGAARFARQPGAQQHHQHQHQHQQAPQLNQRLVGAGATTYAGPGLQGQQQYHVTPAPPGQVDQQQQQAMQQQAQAQAQAQAQVPPAQPQHQLPYQQQQQQQQQQHHHHHQQQQVGYEPQGQLGSHHGPPGGQPVQMQVPVQQAPGAQPAAELLHHRAQLQPGPIRQPPGQQQRASPYSSHQQQAQAQHIIQQQAQPVRSAPVPGLRAVGQQYSKPIRDHHHSHQQQHLPLVNGPPEHHQQVPQMQAAIPAPQQQQQQQSALGGQLVSPNSSAGYPPGPGAGAGGGYLARGQQQQQPSAYMTESEQHYPSSSPTLLQQQLNRQTGGSQQRLGGAMGPMVQQQQPRAAFKLAGAPGQVSVGQQQAHHQHQHQHQHHQQQQQRAMSRYEPAGPPLPPPMMAETYEPAVSQQQQPPVAAPPPPQRLGAHYPRAAPPTPQSRPPLGPQRMAHAALGPGNPQPAPIPLEHPQVSQQLPHLLGNPTPPLTPTHLAGGPRVPAASHVGAESQWSPHHGALADHGQQPQALAPSYQPGAPGRPMSSKQLGGSHLGPGGPNELAVNRVMPKNANASNSTIQAQQQQQQHQFHASPTTANGNPNGSLHHHAQTSQVPSLAQAMPTNHSHHHHHNHHQHHHHNYNHGQIDPSIGPQVASNPRGQAGTNADMAPSQTRLTLPLCEAPLLGPFRLDHDVQFTSKVFHIKPQVFDTLSKSMNLINPHTATVIQELQFRAYLTKSAGGQHGDSLLASNNQPKACNWPEMFQVSVNQNVVHLDRSKANHRPVDVFQFCNLGDNMLEIQVNGCYCSHEFLLEAVDRPTLKAFMNSCFKSRLLATEGCIQKIKYNFGAPGFLVQNQQATSNGVFNEYITEFIQGIEQTKTRISLKCPISACRMRTPTRGHDCKHLQCFDLENFLFMNRERSQWNCPICSLPIPFNMLELDQHQIEIIKSMSGLSNIDDILMDANGQWHAYYGPSGPTQQQQQQQPQQPQQQQHMVMNQASSTGGGPPIVQTTAKSTGTYHPQPPSMMSGNSPSLQQQHSPMRPMSGPNLTTGRQRIGAGSPASWDIQNEPHRGAPSAPVVVGQLPSTPTPGRRSANGSPLAKKPYAGQYAQSMSQQQQQQPVASPLNLPNQSPASASGFYPNAPEQQQPPSFTTTVNNTTAADNTDDLSPLAAMERTIIQHEQQMGPPPFDPNNLTSSPGPLRGPAASAPPPPPPNSLMISPSNPNSASNIPTPQSSQGQQQPAQQQQSQPLVQASPEHNQRTPANIATAFSPAPHHVSSPASRMVPASPQQQQQRSVVQPAELPPQSPMQQQLQQQTTIISTPISTPATPSSSLLVHGGPETPATPSNSGSAHCGPSSVPPTVSGHSPHVVNGGSLTGQQQQPQPQSGAIDHQPLSNGSASAGSITSTSTMTPSGQSLGSVGMGGDSRCGTAPLQGTGALGLDDLMLPGGSSGIQSGGQGQQQGNGSHFKHSTHGSSPHIDEKNDILMGKLMMDSNESILRNHPNHGELAIALEEAEWKQQLDRGKSEHLANFLNEPLMNKQHHQHYNQQQTINNSKMLSGGLNPSDDDEANQSPDSSPSGHNMDQLEFVNYLDADTADNGAGLPPDDSILDLFER